MNLGIFSHEFLWQLWIISSPPEWLSHIHKFKEFQCSIIHTTPHVKIHEIFVTELTLTLVSERGLASPIEWLCNISKFLVQEDIQFVWSNLHSSMSPIFKCKIRFGFKIFSIHLTFLHTPMRFYIFTPPNGFLHCDFKSGEFVQAVTVTCCDAALVLGTIHCFTVTLVFVAKICSVKTASSFNHRTHFTFHYTTAELIPHFTSSSSHPWYDIKSRNNCRMCRKHFRDSCTLVRNVSFLYKETFLGY